MEMVVGYRRRILRYVSRAATQALAARKKEVIHARNQRQKGGEKATNQEPVAKVRMEAPGDVYIFGEVIGVR
jgi:hypothetical protein